jgi:hypothetical protein
VRYRHNGKDVIGLRKEGVAALVGRAMIDPVVKDLRERGAIIKGHGGKTTQQLKVELKIGQKTNSKPRFLIIDPKRLTAG